MNTSRQTVAGRASPRTSRSGPPAAAVHLTAPGTAPGASSQCMADALHAIIEADRTVCAGRVVNRLQDGERVIAATESLGRWTASPRSMRMPQSRRTCVNRQHNHRNSPRTDFGLGGTIGRYRYPDPG